MSKLNFKKFEVQTSCEGTRQTFDIAKTLGNCMMYNGSVLLDIGFEELAREIYYSEGEVEVPERYRQALTEVVKQTSLIAAIKREIIKQLENNA